MIQSLSRVSTPSPELHYLFLGWALNRTSFYFLSVLGCVKHFFDVLFWTSFFWTRFWGHSKMALKNVHIPPPPSESIQVVPGSFVWRLGVRSCVVLRFVFGAVVEAFD